MAAASRCGCLDHDDISTHRKFKCKACLHQFSVTSGTNFASRKMAFVDLLAAMCIFVNGAKGISALQLSRDLNCQYKTAFVLSHKPREAMAAETAGMTNSEANHAPRLPAGCAALSCPCQIRRTDTGYSRKRR